MKTSRLHWAWPLLAAALLFSGGKCGAQGGYSGESFTFKIYKTNWALFPFVQVYFRTFDQNKDPLINLNYANIGLMVQGRSYDPAKVDLARRQAQYSIETLQNREEGFRTVIVWDCSKTMAGGPFADARTAIQSYIQIKRPSDQIAILAIRDTKDGYQVISQFEKDQARLFEATNHAQCDGKETHLYDAIGGALEMCALASQGGTSDENADYAALNTIIVVSDGKDEGSSISREELSAHLARLDLPVPVYSIAFSGLADGEKYAKNLQNISKQTFGKYWTIAESKEAVGITRRIHEINRMDYVVTFHAYPEIPDGQDHNYQLAIRYPANTGKGLIESGKFQAIDARSFASLSPRLTTIYEALQKGYPSIPDALLPMAHSPASAGPTPALTATGPLAVSQAPASPSASAFPSPAAPAIQSPIATTPTPAATPPPPIAAIPPEPKNWTFKEKLEICLMAGGALLVLAVVIIGVIRRTRPMDPYGPQGGTQPRFRPPYSRKDTKTED